MADIKPGSSFNSTYRAVALNSTSIWHVWGMSLEYSSINDNFTTVEIRRAIDYPKRNKSLGIDCIPVEFIKCSNLDTGDRRGIIVLSVIENIFEIIICQRWILPTRLLTKRISIMVVFLLDIKSPIIYFSWSTPTVHWIKSCCMFCRFCQGIRSHNPPACILQSNEKWMAWSCHWYVEKSIWQDCIPGEKNNGRVSSMIMDNAGVNQGVAIGILLKKYMADLESYFLTAHGVCSNSKIIANLLFSDTFHGLQIQLDSTILLKQLYDSEWNQNQSGGIWYY